MGGALSILHVTAPARFGGLESVVRELATGHARRGHTVRVVLVLAPGGAPHPMVAALESAGVAAIPVYVGNRDYRGERRALRALCREHNPSIVHTHGYRCDVVDGGLARSENIGVVSTCHGFIEADWRGFLYQWIQRRALRHFDAVVAVSPAIRERLIAAGVDDARISLVPNAVASRTDALSREEARRLLALPEAPAIGWVGRLSAEKGPDLALEALARLSRPDARLVFIGSGREEVRLRALATELGVKERVIWSGSIPHAERLFRAFDAFLLSSRTEGTPMVLLEAMSAEVPIVATRVGGIPDVVDSQSAYLVDSGDANEMATGLADVLSDSDASHVRVARARERVEHRFAIEPWLSAYESIYRSVVASR